MVQPEVVTKATAILGLQVFSLKIYNLSWGKRCHNPWFKQRSRWKNSRATIFHTEMVKMITWGHAQGPTKRGFRLKTWDQKWGEMRSKYSCLLLYYMKYSVFFGKSWIVSQQTESGRICFFQIKGKCTLFGGPRKFMRYRWIITLGCKWRFSSGFPTTTNDVLLEGNWRWHPGRVSHPNTFTSFTPFVDPQGCRFGPEKISATRAPGNSPIFRSIGYHLKTGLVSENVQETDLQPLTHTRKQKRAHQKPNRLESEKHMSESTVMERHHSPGRGCYTIFIEKAASWQLDVQKNLEPVCPCFFGLQPSQKMALSKQNNGHFPGSRFRFRVYLGSCSPQITRQIPRLLYYAHLNFCFKTRLFNFEKIHGHDTV